MSTPLQNQFGIFFQELHGYTPYPWQQRLADRLVKEGKNWPNVIDLPTGSGKTACIDIAVFALACRANLKENDRSAPRRIFFCVNRRVIVDEAYQRAKHIAKAIWAAERNNDDTKPILKKVACALRAISGTTTDETIPPLDALELRGGIYRDNRWARSAMQPTIICTTLDQLGSRLLFRGYGVSSGAAPIQAALIAYDSLILLDEAHISRPFLQTLENVQRYLDPDKWAEQSIGVSPMRAVPMTATPPDGVDQKNVLYLSDSDRKNDQLNRRLIASKPATLKKVSDVAKEITENALNLAKNGHAAIGIIVNRVATARGIYNLLKQHQAEPVDKKRKVAHDTTIELVIGSMRPIDRDDQAERLRLLIGPDRPGVSKQTSFTVATQCLEVGADYDFDVLITECASLDALRQRFGRLNRAGREISAQAFVLAVKKDIKTPEQLENLDKKNEQHDPIYGNALARTWNWLNNKATDGSIDFGIDAMDELFSAHGNNGHIPENLLAPSASLDAPVMLPAYVDFWCQTSPQPVPDPDISLFIHGSQHGDPDVQVCWRADLIEDGTMTRDHWCDVVALLPPSSAECMSVPISRLRRWLREDQTSMADGDLLGIAIPDDDRNTNHKSKGTKQSKERYGVLWRGPLDSVLIDSPDDLRPGDTLVLPASVEGKEQLGHLPTLPASPVELQNNTEQSGQNDPSRNICIDKAEAGFLQARDRASLRIHRSLRRFLPKGEEFDKLFDHAIDPDDPPTVTQWRQLLDDAADTLTKHVHNDLKHRLEQLANVKNNLRIAFYPDSFGVVITTQNRLDTTTDWYIPALDDGNDESSRINRKDPVTLVDHTKHVLDRVRSSVELLLAPEKHNLCEIAAQMHDLGKADERFQAMLQCTDRTDAWLLAAHDSALLAKSGGMPQTRSERIAARHRAGLPKGFRHEMLSVQLAERDANLPSDPAPRDLVLHLIAAHHGRARPFAPVVLDEQPPAIEVNGLTLTTADRLSCPAHRLDSGIAERFWLLTRRFGWWGLAYLEAILRLADQQASASEDTGISTTESAKTPAEVSA